MACAREAGLCHDEPAQQAAALALKATQSNASSQTHLRRRPAALESTSSSSSLLNPLGACSEKLGAGASAG